MIRYRKIGGIRFLRIGRYQFSWCRLRQGPTDTLRRAAGPRAVGSTCIGTN